MANKNFVVKNGLTVGNLTIDAESGNLTAAGSATVASIRTDNYFFANGAAFTGGGSGSVGYTGSQGNTGLGFKIAKSYLTVAALTADTAPSGIAAGEFALIETGNVNDADNSKLYLWSGTAYSYVTDLSGAAGITGPAGATGPLGYTGSAGVGSTSTVTTGNTSPVSPSVGDWWYYTVTDTLLQYMNVGNGTYWIDVSGPVYNFGTSASTIASIALSATRNLEVGSTSGAPFVLTGIGVTENRMSGYSTNRSNGQTGTSVINVLASGTVYWSFSVSSEGNYDFLTVTSSSQGQIYRASGSNTTTGSYAALAGETITLAYSKDSSDSAGADTGYVNYLYVL